MNEDKGGRVEKTRNKKNDREENITVKEERKGRKGGR